MTKQYRWGRSRLSLAILASLTSGLTVGTTYAQEAAQEIMVTGSRIQNVDGMTTPTPVTAISVDELSDFNPGTTVAEQLDALPQFFGTTTAQRGGNSISETAGGSFLNLRGMGLNRTLVLLDGSRIIPADANGSVNIDNFPSALMQRVDVVTGGASAAYGADAVAGVVNFVLNREFEGLKFNASAGTSQEGEGDRWNMALAGGTSFMDGKLHFVGSFEAREIDEIQGTVEGIGNFKDWGYVTNPNAGQPGEPARITVPYVFNSNSFHTGMIFQTDPSLDGMVFTEDGSAIRPYQIGAYPGANAHSGGNEYDDHLLANEYGVTGNLSIQRSTFLSLKYDFADNFSVDATAIIGRTESHDTQIRSNFNFSGFGLYSMTVFRDNYYLPDSVAAMMDDAGVDELTVSKVGYIPNPGTKNIYEDRHNFSVQQLESYSFGFDWDINDSWTLEGNYQIGEARVQTGIRNAARIDKYFMAMDVIDDGFGNPICRVAAFNPTPEELAASVEGVIFASAISLEGVPAESPVGPFVPTECVPLNIMGNGNISQEAYDWITDEEKKHTRLLDQDFAEVVLSGQLYEGWGAGPVGMAAGLTWRDESFTRYNEPLFSERGVRNRPEVGIQGISAGFAGAGNRSLYPFSTLGSGGGEGDVTEYFVEFNVPIIEFDGGQRVDTSLAYRSSDYSGSGRVASWKIGTDIQVTNDLRWRITKSHDVREPNFGERFLTSTGGATVDDPDTIAPPEFRENIVITSLAGGNPELGLEEADTVTTGFVYQPTFAPWVEGLQLSVDWYEIDLKGAVDTYGTQRLIDDCVATGDPGICRLVERNPTTNIIERVINSYQNVGAKQNRGVDVEMQYSTDVNFFGTMDERLSIRAFAGYLAENSTTSISGTVTDDVGTRDRAEYSGTLSANYRVGDFGAGLTAVYYGDTVINDTWTEGVDIDRNRIASQTIFNLNLSYGQEMASGGQWRTAFTVSNLFDRDAPIITSGTGQVWSNSHDQYGRRFQVSFSLDY